MKAIQFVIILPEFDYWDPMRADFEKLPNVYVKPKVKGIIKKNIYKIHMSLRLSMFICIPFKWIWLHKIINFCKRIKRKPIIFVIIEGANCGLHHDLLKTLKRKIPGSKYVYYCTNTLRSPQRKVFPNINMLKKNYDLSICFDHDDACNFGLCYYKGIYSPSKEVEVSDQASDLLFIGNDKGRLNLLHSIYDVMTGQGIRCNFYINNVPKEKQIYKPFIHYNEVLSYFDVISLVKASKCILEIIWDYRNNFSFRTWEALVYGKKLITNNVNIKKTEFYNPKTILVFESGEDLQADFIKDDYSSIIGPIIDDLAPKTFLEFVAGKLLA